MPSQFRLRFLDEQLTVARGQWSCRCSLHVVMTRGHPRLMWIFEFFLVWRPPQSWVSFSLAPMTLLLLLDRPALTGCLAFRGSYWCWLLVYFPLLNSFSRAYATRVQSLAFIPISFCIPYLLLLLFVLLLSFHPACTISMLRGEAPGTNHNWSASAGWARDVIKGIEGLLPGEHARRHLDG
jgi:hypothetical protein